MSELTGIEQTMKKDMTTGLSWLQRHERIILTVIVAAALLFGVNKFLDVTADRDKEQASIAAQTLSVQQSKDVALAQQSQQDAKQYQATVAALTQQNAQLAAAAANRTIVLQQQQVADKTLPPNALADRWSQLAGLDPGDLTVTPTGVTVTPQAALKTTIQLEQVPVLTANLADAQAQNQNSQAELSQANKVIADQGQEIAGLHIEITDTKKADAAELTSEKAKARKGKLRSFLYGVGVGAGAVAGLVIHAIL